VILFEKVKESISQIHRRLAPKIVDKPIAIYAPEQSTEFDKPRHQRRLKPEARQAASVPNTKTNYTREDFESAQKSADERDSEDWFYEVKGTRKGPVIRQRLRELFDRADISLETLVWTKSFGGNWRRLADTDIANGRETPPPLPASKIGDGLVWLYATIPIIGALFEKLFQTNALLRQLFRTDDFLTPYIILVFCYASIYSFLAMIDTRNIKKSGRKPNWDFVYLQIIGWLAPVYLYQRARALSQPLTLFWIWIVAFIASIIILNPGFLTGDFYWGVGLPSCEGTAMTTQVKKIFNGIPFVSASGALAVAVMNQREINSSKTVRTCQAIINTALGGNVVVQYVISEQGDQYYINLQIIN